MILLQQPDAGVIRLLGVDLDGLEDEAATALRRRIGVMFQQGGLFGSLSVTENIGLPLREHTHLDDALIDELAALRLAMTGLAPEVGAQFPSELSGGMKRAALARALVLDPEILFLDEPTAGLDPQSAEGVDELILKLRDLSGLTIVMITHDLDLLWQVTDRVAVLADGKVQGVGSMQELSASRNPAIRPFFEGPRARAAGEASSKTRVKYALVGAFVLVLGALLVGGVLWLASGGDINEKFDRYPRHRGRIGVGAQPQCAGEVQRRGCRQGARDPPGSAQPRARARGVRHRARHAGQCRYGGDTEDAGPDGHRVLRTHRWRRELRPLRATPDSPYPLIKTQPSLSARIENVLTKGSARSTAPRTPSTPC